MMVEQPFGLPQFRDSNLLNYLNEYIETKYPQHGNCESASLALCWYLSDKDCLVASQSESHTIVLYSQKVWIDLVCGIIINKDFSRFQKLKNFDEFLFNSYWGPEGVVTNSNFIFSLIKVSFYRRVKLK